jgi:hypothetical protein
MLTNEEMERLVSSIIARCDDRYVKQDNCDTRHTALNERQNDTEKKVTVTSTQLSTLIKVLACIGSAAVVALVTIAVKFVWGGA